MVLPMKGEHDWRMLKVTIVQEYVPQYRTSFFELLYKRGIQQGIEIRVAAGVPGRSLHDRNDSVSLAFGVSIRQWEARILGRRLVVRQLGNATIGADLIILEQARRNLDAYRFLVPGHRRRHQIALWGHGRDYTKPTTVLDRSVQRWLTSRADWFFAYTTGGIEAVVADGFPRSRTTLVQNSIDTTSLRESISKVSIESVAEFRSTNSLQDKTALFIGALDESKRLRFLVDAAQQCHEIEPGFRLLIAGDGAMRPEVERWASQNSWLTYLGPISGERKAVALAAAQVLAMPGRVGLVAVDSFAAGIPIVTTDWAWHAPEFEYLENGRNAIICADHKSDYARALTATLGNAPLLFDLRVACLRDSELVTVGAMVENFLEGIRDALESRRS